MKIIYIVKWNRGDDEGQQTFKKFRDAKKYAKSVHGHVVRERTYQKWIKQTYVETKLMEI